MDRRLAGPIMGMGLVCVWGRGERRRRGRGGQVESVYMPGASGFGYLNEADPTWVSGVHYDWWGGGGGGGKRFQCALYLSALRYYSRGRSLFWVNLWGGFLLAIPLSGSTGSGASKSIADAHAIFRQWPSFAWPSLLCVWRAICRSRAWLCGSWGGGGEGVSNIMENTDSFHILFL